MCAAVHDFFFFFNLAGNRSANVTLVKENIKILCLVYF